MATTKTIADFIADKQPSPNKVSVGFKVSPLMKLKLSNAAADLNLTLSEFCEMVMSNFYDFEADEGKPTELAEKIEFYENDFLKNLYEINKDKKIDFKTADGSPMSIQINSVQDVFTVLILSFKIKNHG